MENKVTNIELIQQAIDIERKFQYIDIKGQKRKFSEFIISELQKLYKESKKNPKWAVLTEAFEHYKVASYTTRIATIKKLVTALRPDNGNDLSEKHKFSEDPKEINVMYLKGVGPKIAYLLNRLGIESIFDLIHYFPKKHVNYSATSTIKKLKAGENVTIIGWITKTSAFSTKNKLTILKVEIKDTSAKMTLNFFYRQSNKYMLDRYKAQFPVDSQIMISGKVKLDSYTKTLTIDKPEYQLLNEDEVDGSNLNIGRIVPIYQVTEGLSVKTLRKAIYNALEKYKDKIDGLVPEKIKEKYGLLNKQTSLTQIHFPDDMETMNQSRYSLVFEELFVLQLKLFLLRESNKKSNISLPIKIKEDGLVNQFIENLPFELTNSQRKAVNEILNDLNSESQMQRLLQGDVGSGKTVVATIMLLSAIENGYQSAIMAPTEILAQQHFNNMINWLTPLGVSVSLFTGNNSKKVRNKIETDLRNGQTHIAIGTHALIQDKIEFKKLGAIVIDEQHRFGVNQRFKLSTKGKAPQILTMTATPIPRTLALTVHGDLDITTIDEMPKGRKPIVTKFLTSSKKQELYKLIEHQIELGHQAYIVYPLIEESETLSAKAATVEAERLQREIFPHLKIGLLHGKLPNEEKDQIMQDFKNKKYDILVSTTVVEVGVDVENATIMAIEDAHRFGLSQLHQLRGRVGRSNHQSYCILLSNSANEQTKQRLDILTQTNNGFIIAEKDLEIRGPGEYMGTRQSGLPDLLISDLSKDLKILEEARQTALTFITTENLEDYKELSKEVSSWLCKNQDSPAVQN